MTGVASPSRLPPSSAIEHPVGLLIMARTPSSADKLSREGSTCRPLLNSVGSNRYAAESSFSPSRRRGIAVGSTSDLMGSRVGLSIFHECLWVSDLQTQDDFPYSLAQ